MADDNNLYGKAYDLDKRGHFCSFDQALNFSLNELKGALAEKNPFYDSLVDRWTELFPRSPAIPGRCEDGIIFLYVRSAPQLFLMRARLPAIRARLAKLPDAPKRLQLRLEIHAQ